jgi:glycosyltransferase involved in cell wall biosynthesis
MTELMIVIHSLRGGGSERTLINLLKGIDRNLFSVTLVLYERVFDFPPPDKVKFEILDIYGSKNIFKLTVGFILKIVKLARRIRKSKPDTILSFLSSTNVTVILAKFFSGMKCRVLLSEHNYPSVTIRNEMYGRITGIFMKKVYPKADKIIAVSEGVKRDLIDRFSIQEEKIQVIYNPVDVEEIERLSRDSVSHQWFTKNEHIIISAGRLTKLKGYAYLIKAFSLVRKRLPCRLLIVGEGEEREKLVRMAGRLNLDSDIEFLGFQKNPFKYMVNSTVFVSSSLSEGFGNTIVEAMALGLPVIATDCPSGPSEIIRSGGNGILVPVGDETLMAEAIVEVLSNNQLRRKLGEGAKIRASAFSIDRIKRYYSDLLFQGTQSSE